MQISSIQEIIAANNSEMLSQMKEDIAAFKCSRDLEVQGFLREKAINYEEHNRTRTYLVYNDDRILLSYFSLTVQALELKDSISNNFRKKLTFGRTNLHWISAYLIAQLGKDDACQIKDISDNLLYEAQRLIMQASKIVAGRIIYLECKKEIKLQNLYEKSGFKYLQDNDDLIQMIKIV
jgi:hypothetical protein